MADMDWALSLIMQFEQRDEPGVWAHIVRQDLADGLRDRLKSPDNLAQGNTNLCGIAAFVHDWLQDDPVGYVWFAIQMFEKGVGCVARRGAIGHVISPSQELKSSVLAKTSSAATAKLIAPEDWIVMAPIREDLNLALHYRADEGFMFFGDMRGLSSVGDVLRLFRSVGYQDVRDCAGWWTKQDAKHLQTAGQYVAANYKVVLFIDYRLLHTAQQDDEAFVATANHFVGMTTPVTLDPSGQSLRFGVFSGGKDLIVPEDGGWMPIKTLEKHYYGFVAAKY